MYNELCFIYIVNGNKEIVSEFIVTGVTTRGKRFKLTFEGTLRGLNHANCINLCSGNRWAIINRKRHNLQKIQLYRKVIPHFVVHENKYVTLNKAIEYGNYIKNDPDNKMFFGRGEDFVVYDENKLIAYESKVIQ